ncbi:MAG: 16S rRNA (guanine(527)-N(7))-methyltransferase RsmG [Erythrobacter sp.]
MTDAVASDQYVPPFSIVETEEAAREYVATLADKPAIERLNVLEHLVLEENTRQNLISKGSQGHIWQRHIADSAQLLEHVPRGTSSPFWLDLGTGAGFPGLVIAALRPEWPVRLVESRTRRVEFLRRCLVELGLESCEVLGDRLEQIPPFQAKIISARAFAPLSKLLSLSAAFSTPQTCYILPKGRGAAHELKALPLRERVLFHVKQSRTDAEAGILVRSFAAREGAA